ncbi:MAG: ATP synthase F0 subunit B [Ilumatobacter fluminis]|uniref:ATP synthase subunit b n=1 Tax=Ilumatobacter fluminis TaxID=467091 RepID=A0A4R7I0C0_9ACTN|nr:ATP synthase F0 subunit B [Ilumatobacter fluminis]TDT16962.1 ATP synthase F0 subcomplex B subunit [Ilumatobacter fluminis]
MNQLAYGFVAADGELLDPARSPHWLWPEDAELIFGTISSLIVFAVLFKFGWPLFKKALEARTERIQSAMDESETKLAEAKTEAAEIRSAAGDIDAERQRRFAEADTEAESILAEGRARLDEEIEELRAAADSDIALIASRASGEIRGEISMLSRRAVDRAVSGQPLDDATQQELIESFISKVGAS